MKAKNKNGGLLGLMVDLSLHQTQLIEKIGELEKQLDIINSKIDELLNKA